MGRITLCLGFLRARHQFAPTLAGFRFTLPTRRGILPGFDLALHGRTLAFRRVSQIKRGLFGGCAHRGLANGPRLEKCPEIGGFHIPGQRFRLRAFGPGFRQRQKQRQNGNQQRNALMACRLRLRTMPMTCHECLSLSRRANWRGYRASSPAQEARPGSRGKRLRGALSPPLPYRQ